MSHEFLTSAAWAFFTEHNGPLIPGHANQEISAALLNIIGFICKYSQTIMSMKDLDWIKAPHFLFFNFVYGFFGCAGSLLLLGLSSHQQAGLPSSCGVRAAHGSGFALEHGLWAAWASVIAACGFSSSWALEHRLSCSAACGIFPDQGLNPCLLCWGFVTTEPPGKSTMSSFKTDLWTQAGH